ncbi:hypothetical protein Vau01_104950 [Virgisporangium aurantiacum]|uniref:Uncharacterized protein n=2 Tax=Virgisporangium aurantiacum TaxID=175570 RepID=A0A8J4E691_9ACTN|nr:hypothetical protein Vau01_104950 [Virgisporangium aurantiacum]
MSVPEPPSLAADAYVTPITAEPRVGEYGVHAFGRAVASHLARALNTAVQPPTYRENRRDQRNLPKASTLALTVTGHDVPITIFDVPTQPPRRPTTVYAITLDGQPVPFETATTYDLDGQLARAVWVASRRRHHADRRHPTHATVDAASAPRTTSDVPTHAAATPSPPDNRPGQRTQTSALAYAAVRSGRNVRRRTAEGMRWPSLAPIHI